MPVNDFTAAPTATTFHGVEISANMILAYSPHENSCFFAHIIKYQLTKFAPDFHLNDLHQALGIADMGQKYTEVIYPKILNALKARIRTLQSHKDKDYHPFAKAVVEDGRIRFYAKFMDAWAEPHWQGNMVKPPEQKNQVQEAPPPQPPTQPDPSITPQVPPVPLQPPNPAVQQTCPQASVAWSPFAQPPTSQPAPVIQHTSAQLGSSQQASLQGLLWFSTARPNHLQLSHLLFNHLLFSYLSLNPLLLTPLSLNHVYFILILLKPALSPSTLYPRHIQLSHLLFSNPLLSHVCSSLISPIIFPLLTKLLLGRLVFCRIWLNLTSNTNLLNTIRLSIMACRHPNPPLRNSITSRPHWCTQIPHGPSPSAALIGIKRQHPPPLKTIITSSFIDDMVACKSFWGFACKPFASRRI
ncbi:hypothetical protein CcaCcLH18_12146 [Colletotrichum camelliae]|nr:hypothetical protein CcaCcLH18_12146 [Colletotrichum camelliae]